MKALLVIDMQYDFVLPKGKLYIKDAESLIQPINNKIREYKNNGDLVIYSQDYHPADHVSFSQWGEHCVKGSEGTQIVVDFNEQKDLLIRKGIKQENDSYSAWYESKDVESRLRDILEKNNIKDVELVGVTEDVCVKSTYDDLIAFGYNATIIRNLTKSINN